MVGGKRQLLVLIFILPNIDREIFRFKLLLLAHSWLLIPESTLNLFYRFYSRPKTAENYCLFHQIRKISGRLHRGPDSYADHLGACLLLLYDMLLSPSPLYYRSRRHYFFASLFFPPSQLSRCSVSPISRISFIWSHVPKPMTFIFSVALRRFSCIMKQINCWVAGLLYYWCWWTL